MDQPAASDTKRIIKVTAGNLRQNHLYITGHHDFFPRDCIGAARRSGKGRPIEIVLDGLGAVIQTDILANAKTGKPRGGFLSSPANEMFPGLMSAT